MEIILSKQCLSLTGCLGRGYGYFIQRRRSHDGSVRFFSQRSKHPPIPRDGHLRFIILAAELAQMRLHISDIRVERDELIDAIREAGMPILAEMVSVDSHNYKDVMNANDIINFKKNNNL